MAICASGGEFGISFMQDKRSSVKIKIRKEGRKEGRRRACAAVFGEGFSRRKPFTVFDFHGICFVGLTG